MSSTPICLLWLIISLLSCQVDGYAITGVSAGVNQVTGERPLRRDINDLYNSGPAWDLFILALQEFQEASQDDPLSYYQIAGIHGLPQIPWDGVLGQGGSPGYCVHSAVTFPTWHRPYVALFEQIVWQYAQQIARSYPPERQQAYMAAAMTLRMPYWDAFANASLPLAVSLPKVLVEGPSGTEFLDNPLYNFTFHADEGGNRLPPDHWAHPFSSTVRHVDQQTRRSTLSAVNAVLQGQSQSTLELTYKLFTSESNYSRWSTSASNGNNIESIHNSIHNAVGGYGHMTDPSTSAFEPIFWLHHCNVDRLLAMWQVINPNSYVTPSINQVGTYAVPKGSTETADTNLLPFHTDNNGRFWTSTKARSTRTFGYAYQEIVDWNISPAVLADNVRASVNKLYGPDLGPQKRSLESRNSPITESPIRRVHTRGGSQSWSGYDREWTINLEISRNAHPDPFLIDFFIGRPPGDPEAWSTAPNLAGSYAQFIAMPHGAQLAAAAVNVSSHGGVALTHCLRQRAGAGILTNLKPQTVIPFLRKELTWRARDMRNCELKVGNLLGLSISVGSQTVQIPKGLNRFPTYGKMEFYANITYGKPGGVCD